MGILNLEEMNKKLTNLLIGKNGKRNEAEKSDDQTQQASALLTRLEETLDQAKATASRLSKLEGLWLSICIDRACTISNLLLCTILLSFVAIFK